MNLEYIDIITPENKPTTQTETREVVHTQGLWHRTCHTWITRKNNNQIQVLLQKRAQNKDSFPGKYDTSSAGHITTKNKPRESAVRELYEELGLQVKTTDLTYIGQFIHQTNATFHGKPFIDNEYTYVYLYEKDIDIHTIKLQTDEVESVKWFDIRTIKNAIETNNNNICITKDAFYILLNHIDNKKKENQSYVILGTMHRCRTLVK